MSPPSHMTLPIIRRSRVDFPEPEPPRMTSVSPRRTSEADGVEDDSAVVNFGGVTRTSMTSSGMRSPSQEVKDAVKIRSTEIRATMVRRRCVVVATPTPSAPPVTARPRRQARALMSIPKTPALIRPVTKSLSFRASKV